MSNFSWSIQTNWVSVKFKSDMIFSFHLAESLKQLGKLCSIIRSGNDLLQPRILSYYGA